MGKDRRAGKDCGQKEKGTTEDEMLGQHSGPSGLDFEQTLRDSGGQRSLVCCRPRGLQESDTAQ